MNSSSEPEKLGSVLARIRAGSTGAAIPRSSTQRLRSDMNEANECPRCQGVRYLSFRRETYDVEFGAVPCPDCLPPSDWVFSTFRKIKGTEQALKAAQEFAEGDGLPWLVLMGRFGCGKTHLARAVARRLRERMVDVMYIYAIDLIDNLRRGFAFRTEIDYVASLERFYTAPTILIIDDLGAEQEREWARERVEKILNHRYESQAVTMITTNLPQEELPGAIWSRMSDRRVSRVVFIKADDYRTRAGDNP